MKAACKARAEAILGRPMTPDEVLAVDAYVTQAATQAATSNRSGWSNSTPQQKASDVAKVAVANYQQSLLHDVNTLANDANILTGLHNEVFSNPNAHPLQVILDMLEGNANQKGVQSYENDAITTRNLLTADVMEVFNSDKALGFLADRAKTDMLIKEFYNPSPNASADVRELAIKLKEMLEGVEKKRQLYGARPDNTGFNLPQSHNSSSIALKGQDKWIADTLPLLDTSKMVHPTTGAPLTPAEIQLRMEDTYAAIVSDGAYDSVSNAVGSGLSTSSSSMIRQYKDLPFKDGDSYIKYHNEHSEVGFPDLIARYIDRAAHDISMRRKFGSEYKTTIQKLIVDARNVMLQDIPNLTPKFKNEIDKYTKATTRAADIALVNVAPVESVWRNIGIIGRMLTIANSLGKVIFSQLVDLPSVKVMSNLMGYSHLNMTKDYMSGMTTGGKEVMRETGLGMTEYKSSLARFGAVEMLSGKSKSGKVADWMSKVTSAVLKASGMARHTAAIKQASGLGIMRSMSRFNEAHSWADMPVKTKRGLEGNGFTEQDWNLWKKVKRSDVNGEELLTARSFFDKAKLSDADLIAHYNVNPSTMSAKQLEDHLFRLRDRASTQYGNMLETEVNVTVAEVKNKERRLMGEHSERSVGSEFWTKGFLQFKTFGLPMLTKLYGRIWNQDKMTAIKYTAAMFVAYTSMGYVINTLRDLVSGKDPENPLTARAFTRAVFAGGSLIGVGDIFIKRVFDGEKDALNDFASMASLKPLKSGLDIASSGFQYATSDMSGAEATSKVLNETVKNIPGQNLWFLDAFKTEVLDQTRDVLEPGFKNKKAAREERQFNTTRWATFDDFRAPEFNNSEYDKD